MTPRIDIAWPQVANLPIAVIRVWNERSNEGVGEFCGVMLIF